ncbi:unnamed protein product [Dovyalis caffra]|uniref:Uncharacterized protein n=1 Tax=Dovyalis caffra TaxID=77055 RepID=A0AAV1RF82_9ROSI|nr:unnamed protein product [Dovyalis caffra]
MQEKWKGLDLPCLAYRNYKSETYRLAVSWPTAESVVSTYGQCCGLKIRDANGPWVLSVSNQ